MWSRPAICVLFVRSIVALGSGGGKRHRFQFYWVLDVCQNTLFCTVFRIRSLGSGSVTLNYGSFLDPNPYSFISLEEFSEKKFSIEN
jgi:hypothetical protein